MKIPSISLKQPVHVWGGWLGTALGLGVYALFAAGLTSEFWFFAIGAVASALLVWALTIDKAYYGVFLQFVLAVLNLLGIIRILS
jgi:hypothetical protein